MATPSTLNNTMTTLVIGGAPLTTAANQLSGSGGGMVSTNALSGLPFASSVATINGGVLSLVGSATGNQSLAIPTVNFGAGSYIQIAKGAGRSSTLTVSTALTRLNQGTLTFLPSAIANLGAASTEDVIVSTSAPGNTGQMLTVPDAYVRLAGVGQDADFVQYGANGFTLETSTTTASLATSAATSLANLSASTQVGTAINQTIDILAVRTSANITAFDPSDVLRINNGGLIMNGATAPTISANLFFGTSAAAAEALVYVRDGQSGASTISRQFHVDQLHQVRSGHPAAYGRQQRDGADFFGAAWHRHQRRRAPVYEPEQPPERRVGHRRADGYGEPRPQWQEPDPGRSGGRPDHARRRSQPSELPWSP